MKKLFPLIILTAAGLTWWFMYRGGTITPAPTLTTGTEGQSASAAAVTEESASPTPVPVPVQNPEPATQSDQSASAKDFRDWMAKEAEDLDRLDIDAEAKRALLRKRMAEISPAQASELLETIKNPKSAAREKILSTYLLVEGGSRTEAELTALIISPLKEDPNYAPHSEEEMKGIREKSLRIMAIDGLFSRAQVDPSAKAALARAANEAADPYLRSYASNKLRQLR